MSYALVLARLETRVKKIENELQVLSGWLNSDLSDRPMTKLVKSIIETRTFPSKNSWIRKARVSADWFYSMEDEVKSELDKMGYEIVYKKASRKSKRIIVELKEKNE